MFRDRGQKRGFIIFIQLVLNNQSAADPCHPVSTQKTQRRPWLFVPTARVVCSVLARLSWRAGARARGRRPFIGYQLQNDPAEQVRNYCNDGGPGPLGRPVT